MQYKSSFKDVGFKFNMRYFLLIPLVAILFGVWALLIQHDFFKGNILRYIFIGLFETVFYWMGCMLIVTYAWRKFPWEEKPKTHLIFEVTAIVLYAFVLFYTLSFVEYKVGLIKTDQFGDKSINLSTSLLVTLLINAIHEAYFFYKKWMLNFSRSAKLEKDNINAKYEALKAQINPHFLFNSLNSLVTLVEGNEKAEKYIIDLSDFLRYILKSREREVVLLREELEILSKYSHIQKLRFGNNLSISVDIDEKYYHYAVPPLVLQMLVENTIKHNIISKSNPLTVKLYIRNEYIQIENNLQEKLTEISTGNGLKNIKERYSFLTSKNVEIKKTNNKFIVSVPLVLVDL